MHLQRNGAGRAVWVAGAAAAFVAAACGERSLTNVDAGGGAATDAGAAAPPPATAPVRREATPPPASSSTWADGRFYFGWGRPCAVAATVAGSPSSRRT